MLFLVLVKTEYRYIRGCAFLGESDDYCPMKSGTFDVRIRYCTCSGELCNTSPLHMPSLLPAIILPVAIIYGL